eukprot:TRINITY_DN11097_c0_g1_i1.p1 TRINITY_DN11097_c0_g1~~TRINITY_DN11097_c0_g1_i1.p1  ORF type:complete len:469 (+),score=131.99 TRINITY_DN11097_c0_g1_i1:112-1518(+)
MKPTACHSPEFRVLYILVDGIADNGVKAYGMKTPLQHGDFQHFNALAAGGLNGLHDPVQSGLACGSDTAHMSMFSYDPFKLYNGRGAYESMGSGIQMDYNEIAFKCNFAYINDDTGNVERRRVDRDFTSWGLDLCKDLNGMQIPGYEKDYKVTVLHATEHRCGVKISGANLSCEITGTDPIFDNKPLRSAKAIKESNKDAVKTADIVNKLSEGIRARLRAHPINVKRKAEGKAYTNVVLLRGCGARLKVEGLKEKQGMKGFMIAPTAVIAGIGMTFGIDIKIAEGATGYYDSDYVSKARVALENMTSGEYDFGFLHIKGVDDSGHDGNLGMKSELLRRIDDMVGTLIAQLKKDEAKQGHKVKYAVLLTGDHTTPVEVKEHSYEPVPIVISTVASAYLARYSLNEIKAAKDINPIDKALCMMRDGVNKYSELDACEGSLGRFQGSEMMGMIRRFKEACCKCIADTLKAE